MVDKLSPRQQRFVEEYLVDLNGSQAALRAGYSPNSIRAIAYEHLTKPHIQEAIAQARARLSQRIEITQDMVAEELARIGFADLRTLLDSDGNLRPINELSRDQAAAISSVEVVTKVLPGRDDEPAKVEYIHKIRTWDKVAALTQLGRKLGMFPDKPINVNVFMPPDQRRAEINRLLAKRASPPTIEHEPDAAD